MMKRNPRPCWIVLCDMCEEDVFGGDFTAHFSTRDEAIEAIKENDIDTQEGKCFCSHECWRKFVGLEGKVKA